MAEYIVSLPTEEVPIERMCFPADKITGKIVRCKDCKHVGLKWRDGNLFCNAPNGGGTHTPDWYCAGGERKDNSMENRCVICGAVIPEGQQVCPNCVQKEKKSKKRIATFIPSNITAYPAEMHAEHRVMRELVEQEVVEINSKEVNGGLVYTFTFDLDKFREAPVKRRQEEKR